MGYYIAGGVALLIILWFVATYNRFVSLRTKVEEGFSTIDVFLKKRYDLIPNLVETVKGYAGHESQTLEQVVQARSRAMHAQGEAKQAEEGALSAALGRLLMLQESYPDLKADAQFLHLQSELSKIEAEIESARRYYNGTVAALNVKVERVPSNLVAAICRVKKAAFFEIPDAAQRETVRVSFDKGE